MIGEFLNNIDNSVPKLVVMVGIAGSGKSTKALKLSKELNAVWCSSDDFRERLYGDITDQTHNRQLFRYIYADIKENLSKGRNVIFDACNVDKNTRKAFLTSLKGVNCHKTAIFVCRPYESCIKANIGRERVVPERVITNMFNKLKIPQFKEGFDEIFLYYTDEDKTIHKEKGDTYNAENDM